MLVENLMKLEELMKSSKKIDMLVFLKQCENLISEIKIKA